MSEARFGAIKSRLLFSVAVAALTAASQSAYGQTAINIDAGNLLSSPFTQLRGSPAGVTALTNNLNTAISVNNSSTAAQRAQALIDNTITSDNAVVLADGLGTKLNSIFQAANSQATNGTAITFSTNVRDLFRQTNGISQADSGFVKNFVANGSSNGAPTNTPAVGIALPPGGEFSVYDLAYAPIASPNLTGDSRPFQARPGSIQAFSGADYFGAPTSNTTIQGGLGSNAAIPSGHTTFGYDSSILLAMLVPERFQQVMTRASEYGNSRIVLGVHYPMDIIAGRTLATYDLVQMLNNNPAYLNQSVNVFAVGAVTTTNNFQTLFNNAQTDLHNFLSAGCGASISVCDTGSTDRFSNYAQDKADYNFRMTYNIGSVGPTNLAPVVPTGAEVLIATRFPYLSAAQQRDVIATTEAPSGGPLDNQSPQFAGYDRINLFAAADGYGAFNGAVTVTMNAASGGFNAFDAWNNNITDGTVQTGAGGNVVGSLTKAGTGMLVLTGANTYSGGTTVNGGALLLSTSQPGITASVTGLTTVNATGTFGGIGNAGQVIVNDGGTLMAGTSAFPGGLTAIFANGQTSMAGSLNVGGSLALNGASNYTIQAAPGAISKTTVATTATLSGTSTATVSFAPGIYNVGTKAAVLSTAGNGLTGTFSGLSYNSAGINVKPVLSYDPQDVFITLSQAPVPTLPGGSPANAANVGAVLSQFVSAGGTLPTSFQGLYSLSPTGLAAALGTLAGQTGLATNLAVNRASTDFLRTVLDQTPSIAPPGGGTPLSYDETTRLSDAAAQAYAAVMPTKAPPPDAQPQWGIRTQVFGGASHYDGDAATGAASIDANVFGGGMSLEYKTSPATVWGVALAGGETHSNLGSGFGSGYTSFFQGALYGKYYSGGFDFSGAFSGGVHDAHTTRTTAIGGAIDNLQADFTVPVIAGRAEAGYRLEYGSMMWRPYAAVQAQAVMMPAFAEVSNFGTGATALSFASKTETDTRTELGTWIAQRLTSNATGRFRAAWVHDFDSNNTVQAAFTTVPGGSFVIGGARASEDAALLTGMLDVALGHNVVVSGKFDGEFGSRSQSYTGSGTLRYVW